MNFVLSHFAVYPAVAVQVRYCGSDCEVCVRDKANAKLWNENCFVCSSTVSLVDIRINIFSFSKQCRISWAYVLRSANCCHTDIRNENNFSFVSLRMDTRQRIDKNAIERSAAAYWTMKTRGTKELPHRHCVRHSWRLCASRTRPTPNTGQCNRHSRR